MEKKYIRALPILAGIICLISLLFPMVFIDTVVLIRIQGYIWISGYYEFTALGETKSGNLEDIVLTICFLSVVICSIILIPIKKPNGWLILSILNILSVLLWLIEIPYNFPEIDFWSWYEIGFGVIGIFIGSSLAIGGYIVSKITNQ